MQDGQQSIALKQQVVDLKLYKMENRKFQVLLMILVCAITVFLGFSWLSNSYNCNMSNYNYLENKYAQNSFFLFILISSFSILRFLKKESLFPFFCILLLVLSLIFFLITRHFFFNLSIIILISLALFYLRKLFR